MKSIGPILLVIFLLISPLIKNKLKLSNKLSIIIVSIIVFLLFLTVFTKFSINSLFSVDSGWEIDYINYKSIHKLSTARSQKIALIDSGISEFQISENNSIVLAGKDEDDNGHGTMMYSIIKGHRGAEGKVLGIAPDAEVISIKVVDNDERTKADMIITALKKAIELKCTIINVSLGNYDYNQEISDLIDQAINQGTTVVSSSGDYGTADMLFPANKTGVISVGSISANGLVSDFTNAPTETIINAPGDEIRSVYKDGKIVVNSGTSQATAIISGYVALLKDYAVKNNVALSNDDLINILKYVNTKNLPYGNKAYVEAFTEIKQNRG